MMTEAEQTLLQCLDHSCRIARLEGGSKSLLVWIPRQDYMAFVDEAGLASVLNRQNARRKQPHSEKALGEFRELWWNADHLRLLAERMGIEAVESFVDVGCGNGYWTSLMLSLMANPKRVVGVDQELHWLGLARTRLENTAARRDGCEIELLHADVHHLPVDSDSVDMATCQSLLMHVRDAKQALAEMFRVVRPGGLVLCVEPDRLLNYLPMDSITMRWSPEEHGEMCRFWYHCRLGRINGGEGDLAIGASLPGLFVEGGLKDIQIFQRDKTFPILPPYESEENRLWIQELFGNDGTQNLFEPKQLLAWACAGGATEEFARRQVARLLAWLDEMQRNLTERKYETAGGGVMYVVAGRKPPLL